MGGLLQRRGTTALVVLAVATVGLATAGASLASAATVDGTIIATRTYDFTIRTAGKPNDALARMVSYATALGAKDYKYVYGGGHAHAGVPTNGGFDCSGSVAAVLAAGGLWPKSGAVGSDLGLVQELKSRGLIANGPGSGPDQITLYDHPGKTIEMSIDGRTYGVGGDSKGGPGWVDDSLVRKSDLREYHILPRALHASHADSNDVTFSYRLTRAGYKISKELTVGAKVSLSYSNGSLAMLELDSIQNTGGRPFRGSATS
jgi:hypothetical protein